MTRWIGIGAVVVVVVLGAWAASGYNALVRLDQGVSSAWGQVENVYQRRADLVPNLVETVKAAAAFEKDTFTAVAQARAQVGQVSAAGLEKVTTDPACSEWMLAGAGCSLLNTMRTPVAVVKVRWRSVRAVSCSPSTRP